MPAPAGFVADATVPEGFQPDDLSGVKLSPYEKIQMESGQHDPGMLPGTELTEQLPEMVSGALSLPGKALVALGDIPTRLSNIGKPPESPGYTPTLSERGQIVSLPRAEGTGMGAGLANLLAGTAESFIGKPEAAFTAAIIPGEGSIAKAAAALFGSQQLAAMPDQIRNAVTVLNDPDATTAQKVEAAGQPGVSAVLGTWMLRHGLKDPKPEFQGPLATGEALRLPTGAKPKGITDATQERIEPGNVPEEHPGVDVQRIPAEAGAGNRVQPETPVEEAAPQAQVAPTVTETTPTVPPAEMPKTPTATGVRPAIRLVGGKVVVGDAGMTHPEIIERDKLKAEEIDQRGFVDEQGQFMDREQTAAATGVPTQREPERQHSTDLPEAKAEPKSIRQTPQQALDEFQSLGEEDSKLIRQQSDLASAMLKDKDSKSKAGRARYAKGKSEWEAASNRRREIFQRRSEIKTLAQQAVPPQPPPIPKVQAEVQKVAQTEGQRPAKEVKAELVAKLEKAIQDAPLDRNMEAEATKLPKITINIPGDGDFVVFNTKQALSELLSKAKGISTSPGGKGRAKPIPESRFPKEAKLLEVPEHPTSYDAEMAENHILALDSITDGSSPTDLLPKGQWSGGQYNSEPLVKAIWASLPSKGGTTVAQAKAFLESRARQIKSLAESDQPSPPAAAAPGAEGKMAGPGTPSAAQGPDVGGGFVNQAGGDIYGIAARVREQRAKAGQVAPVASGAGVGAKEAVEWGQELERSGADAEKAMRAFEKTKAISFDGIALARGHGEALADSARRVEGKFGTDSLEYRTAQKALSDWDARSKAMQTEWHKIGQAQQGETDIDTGTFTGINRAYRETTGQDLNPAQQRTAKKISKGVQQADGAVEAAKPKLSTAIDALPEPGQPRSSPYVIQLAEKIVAQLDRRADASRKALSAMSMRFSSGVDPTIIGHLANIGASHIGHWGLDFAKWSDAMVRDIGPKLEDRLKEMGSSLKDLFERSQRVVDSEGDKHGANAEPVKQAVKKTGPKSVIPTDVAGQRKAFDTFNSGHPMTPEQVKTLWKRAQVYVGAGLDNKAEIVHKIATDIGIPAKDVLRGLSQSGTVKRVADDVWQKQRQARILKQSAKRWIETANETWLQKTLPFAARAAFTAKTGFHGTVAMGTHAALVLATHPAIFARDFGKMYKLVASPEYYEMQGHELARRPNYTLAQRAGLVNDMSKMEDFNDPRLALRFPKGAEWFRQQLSRVGLGKLSGMGTRGYSVLKILRQDLFDHEWEKLAESEKNGPDGNLSPKGQELAKAIADSVNHMTGVVKTKVPSAANYALFAPKLELSRLSVIAGDPARALNSMFKMGNMSPAEKWFATNQLKEKAKIFAVASGLLMANQQLNDLFGDKKKLNGIPVALGGVGWDPMSSDFMKFRVAGMNVAWGSPFLTMMRLPLRIVQIGRGSGGKTRFLIYPDESMYKTAGSYLRTQESPFLAPIVDLVTKADYQDRPLPQIPGYGPPPPMPKRLRAQGVKPYTWGEFASETVLPIPFEEGAKEIFHQMGATDEQQKSWLKPLVTILGMAATGGRITEDWNKQPPAKQP